MDMAGIRVAKKELRKALKQTLAKIEQDSVRAQSSNIAEVLFALKEYQHAKRISVYLSMPSSEVHTPLIVRDALGAGKRVFIPYFYTVPETDQAKKRMVMDMLELSSIKDFESLKPDAWGIPTPTEGTIPYRANCFGGSGKSADMAGAQAGEGLDLIVTPGMAFDRQLGRLGRGKGFYDRFFERCQKESALGARMPWKVGLALTDQVLPNGEQIPMDETDIPLDALIVGDGSVLRRSKD